MCSKQEHRDCTDKMNLGLIFDNVIKVKMIQELFLSLENHVGNEVGYLVFPNQKHV